MPEWAASSIRAAPAAIACTNPEVELIKADADTIRQAFRNVLDGKVKFRYVIDMKTME